ncbi:bifunctional Ribosomal protein S5 [Babesia duncani]|uniref:Bifunctional Ribosomal protein S5 n=1 Tax=Babesia duncani TaxID=323732 RepID=A0AAD9PHH4_9APIC|nr:bifunctional Ribosomal protein S5 [Babesia duncani]KAK2198130.1 bifunctional Ribosomal protein S5 [Babesia duncani]
MRDLNYRILNILPKRIDQVFLITFVIFLCISIGLLNSDEGVYREYTTCHGDADYGFAWFGALLFFQLLLSLPSIENGYNDTFDSDDDSFKLKPMSDKSRDSTAEMVLVHQKTNNRNTIITMNSNSHRRVKEPIIDLDNLSHRSITFKAKKAPSNRGPTHNISWIDSGTRWQYKFGLCLNTCWIIFYNLIIFMGIHASLLASRVYGSIDLNRLGLETCDHLNEFHFSLGSPALMHPLIHEPIFMITYLTFLMHVITVRKGKDASYISNFIRFYWSRETPFLCFFRIIIQLAMYVELLALMVMSMLNGYGSPLHIVSAFAMAMLFLWVVTYLSHLMQLNEIRYTEMISYIRILERRLHTGHCLRVLKRRRGPPFGPSLTRTSLAVDAGTLPNRFGVKDTKPNPQGIQRQLRNEKQSLAREICAAHTEICSLFNKRDALEILEQSQANEALDTSTQSPEDTREAYRVYRMLRPDAPNFFEEQSFIHMQQKLHQLITTTDATPSLSGALDEVRISPDSIALAIAALIHSITRDLYDFAKSLGVPNLGPVESTSFDEVWHLLVNGFELKRDGSNIDQWLDGPGGAFIRHHASQSVSQIHESDLKEWLVHLVKRIESNSALESQMPKGNENLTIESLRWASLVWPVEFQAEIKLPYPIEKASLYLQKLLEFTRCNYRHDKMPELVQDLIEALKGLGLKDWFNLEANRVEMELLHTKLPSIDYTKNVNEGARSVLRLSSRNLERLLDPNFYGPNCLANLYKSENCLADPKEFQGTDLEQTLRETPENPLVTDEHIEALLSETSSITSGGPEENPVLTALVESEDKFQSQIGPMETINGQQRWKMPAGAMLDPRRNSLVRVAGNADSKMRLDRLYSCLVERRRMRTMTKEGRVYFVRVVAGVGDGNGYFGMGVGFGNDLKGAKCQAISSALKSMYFIDYDPKEALTTPVIGQEYGARIVITPRPMGKGLDVNRKWLPLIYLTGLDNCKVRFYGSKSWLTRARALRKALESIYSRRTACSATGQRFVSLGNPGDFTIHWPDAWFMPISNEYKARIAAIRKRRLMFKSGARRHAAELLPEQVQQVVPNYAAHKLKLPIDALQTTLAKQDFINTNLATFSKQ